MLQALDEQLASPETPEVRHHYQRLLDEGYSEEDTRELLATILSFYIWHTKRGDGYSYADYVEELAQLPDIDWDRDADSPELKEDD